MSPLAGKPLDFSEQLTPADFEYYHTASPLNDPELSAFMDRAILEPAFQEAEDLHGITIKSLPWGEMPQANGKVPYVLVGPINPLVTGTQTKAYLARMVTEQSARVNLASAIPYGFGVDTPDYAARASTAIPELDEAIGVNTIFPDTTDGLYLGLRTVSARDVTDNMVCETIRLKYEANRIETPASVMALIKAQDEANQDIGKLSRIYREYGLWHRSETDGAFMINTRKGWLTTQSKTDKTNVTPNNMSLVLNWSEVNNSIDFVGKKLPSSDAPEFLVAGEQVREKLKGHKNIRIVAHFHHNPTVRGDGFPNLRTTTLIEYGRFGSGHAIIENMKHRGDNGLILEEHGLVWVGETPEQLEDYVANQLEIAKV